MARALLTLPVDANSTELTDAQVAHYAEMPFTDPVDEYMHELAEAHKSDLRPRGVLAAVFS